MLNYDHLVIGGARRTPAGRGTLEVTSPATGEVIGRVPDGTAADIDEAVTAARRAFDEGPWRRASPAERAEVLGRLAKAIDTRSTEFAELISDEVGSPLPWSRAIQVGSAVGVFNAHREMAAAYPWVETRRSFGGRGDVRVRRLPVGVVGAIVPWNAPLFVAALKLAPALAAGCTVVLKPPPEAPLSSYLLAEAAAEAGLPDGVLSVVPAGAEASEHLVRHPGVDKISFTGSTAVGRRIGELCGHDMRRCTLELGGKSAAILLDDVELSRRTVTKLVHGAMSNSGQVCMAQTRILAPRSRLAQVTEALGAAVAALRVGHPADPGTEIGPMISEAARARVETHIARAVDAGGRIVAGGDRPADLDRGWYLRPALLTDVGNTMPIAREELFGPVALVLPYDTEDEAVALANDSEYGLAGSVWTTDPERGETVAARIRSGSVAVNSPAPMDFGSPFGGVRSSGIGREGGPEGITAYVEHQTIVLAH